MESMDITDTSLVKRQIHNNVVQVSFEKADGSIRKMNCTTNGALVPISESETSPLPADAKYHRVFDTDIQEWRSFTWERLLTAEV